MVLGFVIRVDMLLSLVQSDTYSVNIQILEKTQGESFTNRRDN